MTMEHEPFELLAFDGETFDAGTDGKRLGTMLDRTRTAMLWAREHGGGWVTLPWLARVVGASEAGVSARLRDLRKARFGGLVVDRRRAGGGGLFEYRIGDPPPEPEPEPDNPMREPML